MNDLMWILYWIEVLGNAGSLICIVSFSVIGVVLFIGCWFPVVIEECRAHNEDKYRGLYKTLLTKILPMAIVFLCVSAFIPSRAVMYQMLAVKGLTDLTQHERVQELGGKSLDVLEKAMNEYLNEDKSD